MFEAKEKEVCYTLSWKKVAIVSTTVVLGVGMVFAGLVAYAQTYQDVVLPGVQINGVSVGSMNSSELREYLEEKNEDLISTGITIAFQDSEKEAPTTFTIPPVVTSEDVHVALIRMDIDKNVSSVISYGKIGNPIVQAWAAIKARITSPDVALHHITLHNDAFFDVVRENLSGYEREPIDAAVEITSTNPLEYTVVSSTIGQSFTYDDAVDQLRRAWSKLESPHITLRTQTVEPEIYDEDLAPLLEKLPNVLDANGLAITYTASHTKRDYTWNLKTSNIVDWLEVQKNEEGLFGFGVNASSTKAYIADTIAPTVDIDAKEALFQIGESGKVTSFQASRPGVSTNLDESYKLINDAILQRSWFDEGLAKSMTLAVDTVEPAVQTADVNDLGITEILGVGHSKFTGSSYKRIQNIRHGVVDKLHGRLIKPDEEFSLVQALRPFTLADGYVEEKVIKGNLIEKEVGGGLCQIGTTMFRAAMNSGLDITQRTNHGLVVSYYNDLTNGLPGTDATIYDGWPDFRFLNDTGNYILIDVDLIVATSDLYITFWGTNDGREGSYVAPVVHQWIPYGEEQRIETTKLEPGVEECQPAHTGAVASFTYTRTLPGGETVERVFNSRYRAVPRICLVGVEELTQCQELPDGTGCSAAGAPTNGEEQAEEVIIAPPEYETQGEVTYEI